MPKATSASAIQTDRLIGSPGINHRSSTATTGLRKDAERGHHDHLIDITSGEVIECVDDEIELLQEQTARRLGYVLKGHRLELYGVPRPGTPC